MGQDPERELRPTDVSSEGEKLTLDTAKTCSQRVSGYASKGEAVKIHSPQRLET